jgi:hypothetical protein
LHLPHAVPKEHCLAVVWSRVYFPAAVKGRSAPSQERRHVMSATQGLPEVPREVRCREINDRLEAATPQEILRWAVETYQDTLTMATAFGAEGCCLLAMVAQIRDETGIVPDIFNPSLRCIGTFGHGTPVLTAFPSPKGSKYIDT